MKFFFSKKKNSQDLNLFVLSGKVFEYLFILLFFLIIGTKRLEENYLLILIEINYYMIYRIVNKMKPKKISSNCLLFLSKYKYLKNQLGNKQLILENKKLTDIENKNIEVNHCFFLRCFHLSYAISIDCSAAKIIYERVKIIYIEIINFV